MSTTHKNLKVGSVQVAFEACIAKKAQIATVEVLFPGTNSVILQKLMKNFAIEKVIPGSMQQSVFVINAIAGHKSIMFSSLDPKILVAVLAVYTHLHKMALTLADLKQVNTKEDDFKKLYRSLGNFEVKIVGKCKNTFNAIDSETKKLKSFMEACHKIHDKFKDKVKDIKDVSNPLPLNEFTFSYSSGGSAELFNLYISILLGDYHCYVKKTSSTFTVVMLTQDDVRLQSVFKTNVKQRIKSWLLQFGSIGSEPKDSDAKKKWNEKSKNIMQSLNRMSEMTCELHNLPKCTLRDVDQVNNVDSDVLAVIRSIKEV